MKPGLKPISAAFVAVLALAFPALAAPAPPFAAVRTQTAEALARAPAFDPAATANPPVLWRVTGVGAVFRDAPYAPAMVIVPAGEFTRGSADTEAGRSASEGPRGRVRIARAFAVSRYPVTVGEFARFVTETRRAVPDDCWTMEGGVRDTREGRSWKAPGYPQTSRHPVVCVRWEDARAYALWLAKKTGRPYRLLSDSEYEYANRAGSSTTYWWGDDLGQGHANCLGCGSRWDGKAASPVGRFAPNAFGLYDTAGNVWSWLGDCGSPTYEGVPADGSARSVVNCDTPGLRGGSWDMGPTVLRSAMRAAYASGNHFSIGFRVARGL